MKTSYDHKLIRCPKLGDEMTFSYCLHEAGDLPCTRIIPCWQASFDVMVLLRGCMAPADLERFAGAKPKDKMTSLIELIENAKRQT